MARLRSRADLKNFYAKQSLLNDPRTPFGLQAALRTGGRSKFGYLSKLNRLQKKTKSQLKGLPASGPTIRDWQRPY